jgi:hypothetical protein
MVVVCKSERAPQHPVDAINDSRQYDLLVAVKAAEALSVLHCEEVKRALTALSFCFPRAAKRSPEPATRSRTVCDTRVSFRPASATIRAAI